MFQTTKVSSSEAMLLLDSAIKQAKDFGRPLAAAVCGPEGELIAFVRMDGTNPASSRIAQNKAYTAAIDLIETFKLGERMRTTDNPAFWGDPKITGFGGGVPIIVEGKVIGGFGVSGLPEADDIVIAKKAVGDIFGR
jgi:glc operon protein GlcG